MLAWFAVFLTAAKLKLAILREHEKANRLLIFNAMSIVKSLVGTAWLICSVVKCIYSVQSDKKQEPLMFLICFATFSLFGASQYSKNKIKQVSQHNSV